MAITFDRATGWMFGGGGGFGWFRMAGSSWHQFPLSVQFVSKLLTLRLGFLELVEWRVQNVSPFCPTPVQFLPYLCSFSKQLGEKVVKGCVCVVVCFSGVHPTASQPTLSPHRCIWSSSVPDCLRCVIAQAFCSQKSFREITLNYTKLP